MQEKLSNRKLHTLEITPATTVGMRSAPQEPSSPLIRSMMEERNIVIKPFSLDQSHPVEKHWLFEKVLSDLHRTKRLEKHLTSSKKINTNRIDSALSNHLKYEQDKSSFRRKYSQRSETRPSRNKPHQVLSETKLELDKKLLRSLMDNPEERSKIYESSLLQEYYLKDLQKLKKTKVDVSYLKRDFAIVRHRKLANSPQQNEQLYLKHDQKEIEHVRMLNYVRHEKQIHEAVKRAKRNVTYRKQLNLERINYIIECMVARPLAQNPDEGKIRDYDTEIMGKLFFRYSNYEGTEGNLHAFVTLDRLDVLFERLELTKLPANFHKQLFKKLTKSKTEKVLFYFDFVELLRKVATQLYPKEDGKGISPLQEFLNLHIKVKPSMYLSYAEQLQQLIGRFSRYFEKDIRLFLIKSKLQFCIQCVFRSAADKLEYGKLITIHASFETLNSFRLLECIQREKILNMFRYLALYEEGLTLQQFALMLTLTALSDELQLFKSKAQHMRKTVQTLMAKPNGSQIVVAHLRHYFMDRLKLFSKVLEQQ